MFSCVVYLYAPANIANIHRLTSFLLAILRVHFKKESNANTLHIRGILSKLMGSSTLAPLVKKHVKFGEDFTTEGEEEEERLEKAREEQVKEGRGEQVGNNSRWRSK